MQVEAANLWRRVSRHLCLSAMSFTPHSETEIKRDFFDCVIPGVKGQLSVYAQNVQNYRALRNSTKAVGTRCRERQSLLPRSDSPLHFRSACCWHSLLCPFPWPWPLGAPGPENLQSQSQPCVWFQLQAQQLRLHGRRSNLQSAFGSGRNSSESFPAWPNGFPTVSARQKAPSQPHKLSPIPLGNWRGLTLESDRWFK